MYIVKKTLEISASHKLCLPYRSKCARYHGHNWMVTVWLKSDTLNHEGMVEDFSHIKREIMNRFDHDNINNALEANPTAENIAKTICDMFDACFRVDVQESRDNVATYIKDENQRDFFQY